MVTILAIIGALATIELWGPIAVYLIAGGILLGLAVGLFALIVTYPTFFVGVVIVIFILSLFGKSNKEVKDVVHKN